MLESQLRSKPPAIIISKSDSDTPYVLTVTDYTDLARAVEREGPPKAAVAWTLLQRFGLLYPLYKDLSTFVKAYAQPINPQWFSTGARHLAENQRLKDPLLVARENTAASQREGWAKTPLTKISADTLLVLDRIFAGKTRSPLPLASHYAAPITRKSITEARKAQADFAAKRGYTVYPTSDILNDNWFYGEAAMSGVRVRTGVPASIAKAALTYSLAGASGYALWFLIKRLIGLGLI
jgi:hypothetical protein